MAKESEDLAAVHVHAGFPHGYLLAEFLHQAAHFEALVVPLLPPQVVWDLLEVPLLALVTANQRLPLWSELIITVILVQQLGRPRALPSRLGWFL